MLLTQGHDFKIMHCLVLLYSKSGFRCNKRCYFEKVIRLLELAALCLHFLFFSTVTVRDNEVSTSGRFDRDVVFSDPGF